MIGYGDRARTQCEVVRLFRETHPDLPPLNQGTISKIEAQYREMGHVRKVPSKRQAVVDDDTKLNLLLALEENPITPARQLARDTRSERPVVKTSYGKIVGNVLSSGNGNSYYAFQEIPYALPPVGNLRFKEPIPPKEWVEVLHTTENTKICHQIHRANTPEGLTETEDCLYLNIYTPKMPLNYSRKTGILSYSAEDLQNAIRAIKNDGKKIREAARTFNIPESNLRKYKSRPEDLHQSPRLGRQPVFTKETENELREYILILAKLFFGLTPKGLRRLVFRYAEANNIRHNVNRVKGLAGKDWLYGFLKKNPRYYT
ncbi:hypothetical protein NQ318_020419 [Aromia moschata]|uniref:Carboxylesterase type B domain-containing protein n=1 Tax=Aromia moschata TaxID=1265417 RepID=A0AAV8YKU7_9CUCU|nr:hypothetical protein NQ318_020419 [Aromia moschata]